MNDIVSIRNIRPLPWAGAGRGSGAALTCGEDFFLGGNEPSLTVMEFLTTQGTALCPLWLSIWAIAYDTEFSALAPLSAEYRVSNVTLQARLQRRLLLA